MQTDSVFDIGSMTKQFTAAAILRLKETGKLKVTDSVSRFFPNVPTDKWAITIHQLLTQTAGFPHDAVRRDELFRPVHARFGKGRRAEPVAILFVKGKARFAGAFPELDDELCGLTLGDGYEGRTAVSTGGRDGVGDDRADARAGRGSRR